MRIKDAIKQRQTFSFKKDVSTIIQFSPALMGVAALIVLFCHSVAYVNFDTPHGNTIRVALGLLAQYGVKMFFFLSAIRLFFSMKKDDKLSSFYKKRLVRILVPYILIALVCLPLKHLVISHDVWGFITDFFLFGYYIDGHSTWFIAAILPMYFVYPFLYRARIKCSRFTHIAIAVYFLLVLLLQWLVPDYYRVIVNMVQGGFAFLLGIVIAPYVYEKKKFNILLLIGMSIAYLLLFVISMSYRLLLVRVLVALLSAGLPALFCYVGAWFLSKLPQIFNKVLEFCGKMSLELYLLGIVSYIMSSFGLDRLFSKIEPNGFLFYFITMIMIFILAILFFNINKRIVAICTKAKKE